MHRLTKRTAGKAGKSYAESSDFFWEPVDLAKQRTGTANSTRSELNLLNAKFTHLEQIRIQSPKASAGVHSRFGASDATIFSKRASPRSGSQKGSSFNSP
jgi:hypothetical protein